ncbi:MAG: hypothetical protein K6T85_14095 [Gorillibacterium sp.]|nr:hypothetical protein [Gorillibacterium sp.]
MINHVRKTNEASGQTRRSNHLKLWFLVFCMVTLLLGNTTQAHAVESWDGALEKIDRLYNDFSLLETSLQLEGQQIRLLRKQNNDNLKSANTRIQAIDQGNISQLKLQAEQAQLKHAPLLKLYTELGKQATAARKAKNSKAAVLLDLKRNNMKASVVAARSDVKAKQDALTSAKKQAANKAQIVKDALVPVQTLKKQVAAENKIVTATEKLRSEANKRYKACVKMGNAITAMTEMQLVYEQMVRIQASQHKLSGWEGKISDTIRLAAAKLPK